MADNDGAPATRDLTSLPIAEWHPEAQLRLPETVVVRAAVPAIDVHNHLGRWLTDGDWRAGTSPWIIPDVGELLSVMDECGVDTIVNLDGMWGDEVTANVERYDSAHPGRFVSFCQLDWGRLAAPDGVPALIASLDDSAARGARGVKVWKNLGLEVHDAEGSVILPDDPRVIEVLTHAGELGLPVLIHTADPKAFFEPLDERNERLDELAAMPEWWFGDRSRYPAFLQLMASHAGLVAACPGTRFIGAHVGGAAEDLDLVSSVLDANPNYSVDIGGRMAELGRQPRRTASFIERHPDRVLFGTDIYPAQAEYFRLHFRFLETADEAFSYAPGEDVPPQGRWSVSALALDPTLLPALYRDNAARVLAR